MKIIVTDSGHIWNHENPYFEKYREIMFVVCLSGKKVTDKYQCFVSPYEEMDNEITKYGMEDRKYQALASVAGRLNSEMHYHDDIVFLPPSYFWAYNSDFYVFLLKTDKDPLFS